MKFFKADSNREIKVVIFDFDETMYYSEDIRKYYIEFIKKTIMTLGNHTEEEAIRLMNEVGITIENKNAPSFNSSLPHFGITREQWDDYRIDHYFEIDYTKAQIVDNDYYKRLAAKYRLYIASNELYKNIIEKADRMGIELTPFYKIYAPQIEELNTYPKKSQLYKMIKESEGVDFDQMLVIGDRMKVDILPMVELGGNALFISTPKEIMNFCDEKLL